MNGELIFSILLLALLFAPNCGGWKIVTEKDDPFGNKTSYYLEERK